MPTGSGLAIPAGGRPKRYKQQVDELYHRRLDARAKTLAEPGDKPWRLREFRVADPDGNRLPVSHDFSWELRQEQA